MHPVERAKKEAVLRAAINADQAGMLTLLLAWAFGRRWTLCVGDETHFLAKWGGRYFWLGSREEAR